MSPATAERLIADIRDTLHAYEVQIETLERRIEEKDATINDLRTTVDTDGYKAEFSYNGSVFVISGLDHKSATVIMEMASTIHGLREDLKIRTHPQRGPDALFDNPIQHHTTSPLHSRVSPLRPDWDLWKRKLLQQLHENNESTRFIFVDEFTAQMKMLDNRIAVLERAQPRLMNTDRMHEPQG